MRDWCSDGPCTCRGGMSGVFDPADVYGPGTDRSGHQGPPGAAGGAVPDGPGIIIHRKDDAI